MPRVRTPRIYWQATKRRVLTMEWIDGVKLTNKVQADRQLHSGSLAGRTRLHGHTAAVLSAGCIISWLRRLLVVQYGRCCMCVSVVQAAMDAAGLDIVDFVDVGIEVSRTDSTNAQRQRSQVQQPYSWPVVCSCSTATIVGGSLALFTLVCVCAVAVCSAH